MLEAVSGSRVGVEHLRGLRMRAPVSGRGWLELIISRRRWLSLAGAVCTIAVTGADQPPAAGDDEILQQEIEAHAKKVGIAPFRSSRTEHYLGTGDAPDLFREKALRICEWLVRDFLSHFIAKGFEVKAPNKRMPVVTLLDAKSYAAFAGAQAPLGVAGFFDGATNRLVIFDNRAQGEALREQAERDNLLALAHEAMHQLTFNTGLLNLAGDVPTCINEGLATYAEVRRPNGSTKLGQLNLRRLKGMTDILAAGSSWIPLEKLLVDDDLFLGNGDNNVIQLAYGQSWLLIYAFMSQPRPTQFRDYLKAIEERKDPTHRLDDAQKHLGDLNKVDQQLQQFAARLSRG
jgi:Protein of unknown function (DUF1570)